jgi:thiamine monophosphate synthase
MQHPVLCHGGIAANVGDWQASDPRAAAEAFRTAINDARYGLDR